MIRQDAASAREATASSSALPDASAVTQQHDEEDKDECPWCKWMKAGGCRDQFQVWMDCVDAVHDAGRKDVESCATVMAPLFECMQAHGDYYQPQIDALQGRRLPDGSVAGEEATADLDSTAAASASTASPTSASAQAVGQDHSQVSSAMGLQGQPTKATSSYADVDDVSDEDLECIIQAWEQQEEGEAAGSGAKAR